MRIFQKPPLPVPQQLELLKQRGLTILNEERAQRFLEVVTLFRLSPYMRPFQQPSDTDHGFMAGTTLRQIVAVYNFDRELRNLIMDAIERFEVAVRAGINNHMSNSASDAHWYQESLNFNRYYDHARLLNEIQKKLDEEKSAYLREARKIDNSRAPEPAKTLRKEQRRRDNYFRYYGQEYDQPELPPSWAVLEELSIGSLSHLYSGIARDADRKHIAKRFGVSQEVLASWLHTLTFVRNCCAHHARLWNRELSVPPKLPNKDSNWQIPRASSALPDPDRRIYIVLMMLTHLMQHVSPDSRWVLRLKTLLERDADISLPSMGFPESWQTMPFWQNAVAAASSNAQEVQP